MSEEKAIPLSQKRNLPFISKRGDIVREFPKTKPKPGVQSPRGYGKDATPVSGKRKREEEQKQTTGKPKRFIPKLASSGPPRTKEKTPPEHPQSSKSAASESRGRAGKVLETTPLRRKMGSTPKRKRSSTPFVSPQATPKRRSMRVLQARFTGAHTSGSEASGTRTVVTIDDDSDDGDSDDGDTTESEASTPGQEDIDNIGEMHEGSDRNDNYDHDGDVLFDDYTEEQGSSDTFSRSVTDIAGVSNLVVAIVDPAQSTPEIGLVAQNMEIVPMVAPSFDTLDTLVEAALAESFPTMPSTNSQDTTSINTFASHGTLPVPSHIQPLLWAPDPSPLALLLASSFGNTSAAENAQAIIVAENTAAKHLSDISWLEWEESFATFMAFFDGGVQVLRSADELLPLCHRFNGYATFRGALVSLETVAALEKFLDKYGDFTDMTSITSSFSRCTAFRTLGLVLHGMDTTQLLDITDHRLLCWWDAICEAMTLGFWVEFLLNLVKDLARVVFGERAIHGMESFSGSDNIRAAAKALNLKPRELENQHGELRALLLAQGISPDSAGCVMEAMTRYSHKASSVLF
ncbi:unnamed protein product [Prunus brigantina]